jgi:rubrerythrin
MDKERREDMDKEKMLEGLRTALQTELNGMQFYRIAAEKTNDAKGKEMFMLLAKDEELHFKELQRQFDSLMSSSTWTPPVSLAKARTLFNDENPIFSEEMKQRIKGHHFEMSALSIGALLESNSIDFYRRMKEESSDPQAREFFEQLQKWEQRHLEAITRQMDVLKEEYWAEQHFTPLF